MKEEEAAAKGGQAPKSPKSGRMGTHLHWVSKPWHRASGFRGLGRGVMPVLPFEQVLDNFWVCFEWFFGQFKPKFKGFVCREPILKKGDHFFQIVHRVLDWRR